MNFIDRCVLPGLKRGTAWTSRCRGGGGARAPTGSRWIYGRTKLLQCQWTQRCVQPRPIKHAHIGFRVAPGGPAVAGRPPRACRRSRGWGRPGGTLGGPAVGDSGPLHGPDRRALKQANNSSQTRLYTAFLSALPRALRHSFPCGTCNADSTPRQPRRA